MNNYLSICPSISPLLAYIWGGRGQKSCPSQIEERAEKGRSRGANESVCVCVRERENEREMERERERERESV